LYFYQLLRYEQLIYLIYSTIYEGDEQYVGLINN
jgi:hypothetical protein